ncbi:HET-domain-containing protein [Pilatotrama ljubarskyi]|nr:HET-domain-containing protein [Pilatotrama ljubarskyi]
MWLLTTNRAELLELAEPPKEYAILSHVWRRKEQTFEAVRAIARRCASSGENPRDLVADKIRKCCQWAEAHGFKLLWIDTCCINKASSAELSEAINSMYMWYAQATVCYAYLHDTDDGENPSDLSSSFRASRWFTRGWTLQELIAPRDVVFLSMNWQPLASKMTIAKLLEEITGIDAAVLRGQRSLDEISVARRMSWASMRETSRLEDQAYSLMGIFGVNLPTIYGEGSEAFIRLQEEIMRRSPDRSLLAWGPQRPLSEVVVAYRSSIFPTPQGVTYIQQSCLLARSPGDFRNVANIVSVAVEDLASAFDISAERSPLTVSSYGARTMFPLIRFANHCTLALLPCQQHGAYVALVLRFQGTNGPWAIGTRVHMAETRVARRRPSSDHPETRTGIVTDTQVHPIRCVLIRSREDLASCMQCPLRLGETIPAPIWNAVFIAYRAQHILVRSQDHTPKPWSRRPVFAPCKLVIPVWTLKELARSGYELSAVPPSAFLDLNPGQRLPLVFTAALTANHWTAFAVHVGADRVVRPAWWNQSPLLADEQKPAPLWSTVHFPPSESPEHRRLQAIEQWARREMAFDPASVRRNPDGLDATSG